MEHLNYLCLFTVLCFGSHNKSVFDTYERESVCNLYNSEDGLSFDLDHSSVKEFPQECWLDPWEFHTVQFRNLRSDSFEELLPLASRSKFQHLIIDKYQINIRQPFFLLDYRHVSTWASARSLVIKSSTNIISWWDVRVKFVHVHVEQSSFGWKNKSQAAIGHRWLRNVFVHENLKSFSVINCPDSEWNPCIDSIKFLRLATNLQVLRLENSFHPFGREDSLKLPNLRILSLRNNRIPMILISVFEYFPQLEELDLNGNCLLFLDVHFQLPNLRDFKPPDDYYNCNPGCHTLCKPPDLMNTVPKFENRCPEAPNSTSCYEKCSNFEHNKLTTQASMASELTTQASRESEDTKDGDILQLLYMKKRRLEPC